MGKINLSPHDLEQLSAYLDKELSPKDTARLEARLWKDAELRNALDELDRTRVMLRALPRVRAPRNFTLSPEYARRKSTGPRLYPLFGFASALAVVMLMAVLVFDWFGMWVPSTVAAVTVTPSSTATVAADETFSLYDTSAAEKRAITETPSASRKMPPEVSLTVTDTEQLPSETPTASPTVFIAPTDIAETFLASDTPLPTRTERETGAAQMDTLTPEPTHTPTETSIPSQVPTQTLTLEPSPTPTASPTLTPSPTDTSHPTDTPVPQIAMQADPTLTVAPTGLAQLTPENTPQPARRILGDQPVFLVLELGLVLLLLLAAGAALWNYARR